MCTFEPAKGQTLLVLHMPLSLFSCCPVAIVLCVGWPGWLGLVGQYGCILSGCMSGLVSLR